MLGDRADDCHTLVGNCFETLGFGGEACSVAACQVRVHRDARCCAKFPSAWAVPQSNSLKRAIRTSTLLAKPFKSKKKWSGSRLNPCRAGRTGGSRGTRTGVRLLGLNNTTLVLLYVCGFCVSIACAALVHGEMQTRCTMGQHTHRHTHTHTHTFK